MGSAAEGGPRVGQDRAQGRDAALVLRGPRFGRAADRGGDQGPDRRPRGDAGDEGPPVIAASELPVYRPFALLALAVALLAGIPLGLWLLGWLYLGLPAVPPRWLLLHAHLQIFGFFGTLIMGMAQHLLPRFTGRPVSRSRLLRVSLGLQAAGLALRVL